MHVLTARAIGADSARPSASPAWDVARVGLRVLERADAAALDIRARALHKVWALLRLQAHLGSHGREEVRLVLGVDLRRALIAFLPLAAVTIAWLRDVTAAHTELRAARPLVFDRDGQLCHRHSRVRRPQAYKFAPSAAGPWETREWWVSPAPCGALRPAGRRASVTPPPVRRAPADRRTYRSPIQPLAFSMIEAVGPL